LEQVFIWDFTHYWALPYNWKKDYEVNTETLRQYHNKDMRLAIKRIWELRKCIMGMPFLNCPAFLFALFLGEKEKRN
jgi:hypothetical protein